MENLNLKVVEIVIGSLGCIYGIGLIGLSLYSANRRSKLITKNLRQPEYDGPSLNLKTTEGNRALKNVLKNEGEIIIKIRGKK